MTHNLIGRRFDRLTVLEQFPGRIRGYLAWTCLCDCGSRRVVATGVLMFGKTRSCGCLVREHLIAINSTHGESNTPEYRTWSNMKDRCHNPSSKSYSRYGGRGIFVCPAWRESFELFRADVGPRPSGRHSLDRIDNDRGYEPGNVRWATTVVQGRNKSSTHRITYDGLTLCGVEWSSRTGIPVHVIYRRIAAGWSASEVVTVPWIPRRDTAHRRSAA